ncbi:MAG: alpha-galactosidase [Kiritimatiellaeota bacterium]|nr:alpha-galactosidase [Kiritimatiellota bacterium]
MTNRNLWRGVAWTVACVTAGAVVSRAAETLSPPPNASGMVEWNAGQGILKLRYHGSVILAAALRAEDAAGQAAAGVEIKLEPSEARDPKDKVAQRLKFTLAKPQDGVKLVLHGVVTGSAEAFAAETDGPAQKRFPLVRNSVGLSRNLRNNAVYDRRWDWMLEGPTDGTTRVLPTETGQQGISFAWQSRSAATSAGSGPAAMELVFRPRFYQKHRGIERFEPWTYQVWRGPVTGYCTWWAYRGGFSQRTLDAIVDVFAEKKLPDFGYKYVQIDDAYQIGNGSCPQNWLTWNQKFPGGAEYALKKIQSAGMAGGIWVHRVHRPNDPHVADIGKQHADWFVHRPDGSLYTNSGFYILNTRNKAAVEGMVRPIYRELKKQGWGYVKIDGAGDLLNCYKDPLCAEHFKKIGVTPEESLRDWDRVAREELGQGVYILNCWGVHTGVGVVGLVDGCRLGGDGFDAGSLQRYASWNGVLWRGDPDHCDIMAVGFKEKTMMKTFGAPAAMADTIDQPSLVAMAGAVLMVSDKVEDYQNDSNLEGMKRSAPVLFTVPGQLYECGPRATWWLQELDRPFDHWSVLARFNWRQGQLKGNRPGHPEQEVKFADLGLAPDREYLVFEFWTQTFLGRARGSFQAPAQDASTSVQVFAIREARPHPWVLSTTRHLSQGGVDLLDERWDAGSQTLSGQSAVVSGDPYVLTVHRPAGFRLKVAECAGEQAASANQAETATVRIVPSATKTVLWKLHFEGAESVLCVLSR